MYPKGVDAATQNTHELTEPASPADLLRHNKLTAAVGNKLAEWFRSGKKLDGRYTPYLSISAGFRSTQYGEGGKAAGAAVYALRSFAMNDLVTPMIMQWVLQCVQVARAEVRQSLG